MAVAGDDKIGIRGDGGRYDMIVVRIVRDHAGNGFGRNADREPRIKGQGFLDRSPLPCQSGCQMRPPEYVA